MLLRSQLLLTCHSKQLQSCNNPVLQRATAEKTQDRYGLMNWCFQIMTEIETRGFWRLHPRPVPEKNMDKNF